MLEVVFWFSAATLVYCYLGSAAAARRRLSDVRPYQPSTRVLLDACAALLADGVALRCHLVGDGPDRKGLEAHARELGIAAFGQIAAEPETRARLGAAARKKVTRDFPLGRSVELLRTRFFGGVTS